MVKNEVMGQIDRCQNVLILENINTINALLTSMGICILNRRFVFAKSNGDGKES